jgi:GEVED domain
MRLSMTKRCCAVVAAMAAVIAAPGVAVAECACPAIYVGDIPGIDPTIPPRVNPVCLALVTPGNINPVTGNPITIPAAATTVRKSVTRVDNADGTATFSVTLVGAIPTATTSVDVLDCVWIDVNGNGTFDQGESVRAYEASAAVVAGTGANRTIDFQLTVPNAAGRSVCNRATGVNFAGLTGTITNQAGIEAGTWIQAQSNIVCSDFGVPVVVPEAPAAASLLASALGGIGVGWFFMRRRRRLAVIPVTTQ